MKKLFILLFAAGVLASCSDDDKDNVKFITVGFEDVPANILAVDAAGSNFYESYGEGQYTEYTDTESGLHFGISEDKSGGDGINYWNGGTVFSTFNKDLTTNSDSNQCTVNYVDPKTGNGGNKGSKVFGVVNGDATVNFTKREDHTVDHLWVMNTVYSTLAMKNGNEWAKKLNFEDGDYFYVTITGYSASGTKTGSVDFYLADFRTKNSPGIIDQWTKVDLSKLGMVNRLEFSFSGSDVGKYGLNTPAYVCIDDIAVKIEK